MVQSLNEVSLLMGVWWTVVVVYVHNSINTIMSHGWKKKTHKHFEMNKMTEEINKYWLSSRLRKEKQFDTKNTEAKLADRELGVGCLDQVTFSTSSQ